MLNPQQESLVLAHKDLPRYIAYSIVKQNDEDLIQDGLLGLIKAASKFDPSLNFKFTTYAQPLIRGAILDSIRNRYRLQRNDSSVLNDLYIEDDYELFEENALTKQYAEIIKQQLALLSEKSRDIISLRLKGLKIAEIAEIFHCTESNVSLLFSKFTKACRSKKGILL